MQINQEIVLCKCRQLVDTLLSLPEIEQIKIGDVLIQKDKPSNQKLQQAVSQSYHDCYSDVDLTVTVRTCSTDPALQANYAKQLMRFGFHADILLGAMIAQSNVLRVVLKNGMRYDMVFEFLPDEKAVSLPIAVSEEKVTLWPPETVNRFWFIQIQALGKLYRKDFLISAHLANTNLNETLVQQMVLRDEQYGTTHHRYGYQDEISYLEHLNKCPIQTGNARFDWIADQLWCAALTYDELMLKFDSVYQPRSSDFLTIWKCYETNRLSSAQHEQRADTSVRPYDIS